MKEDDPNVASTIDDLKKIHDIYEGIDPGTGDVSIKTAGTKMPGNQRKLVIGNSGSQESTQPFTEKILKS